MKKHILRIFAISALMIAFSESLIAQVPVTIRGEVRVGTMTTIPPGISITIKGTTTGVIPNASGIYTLSAASGVPITLVASLTGYSSVEKTITPFPTYMPGISNYVDFWIAPPPQAIADYDGNLYNTVTIGTQTWMAENLKVTHFNDGSSIQYVADAGVWASNLTAPQTKFCYYDNNGDTYRFDYGALYNNYVVMTNDLCPTGWHVSTNTDWTVLTEYLGGDNIAGGMLKEAGTAHWLYPNDANNVTGFTALPGGSRDPFDGGFEGIGSLGIWWSNDQIYHYFKAMVNENPSIVTNTAVNTHGLSVRCVQDMYPTLTTNTVTSITTTTALCGGNISYDGGSPVITRGICWSETENPTLANDTTGCGSGTGAFTGSLWGLEPGTTYYVRAYAINGVGTVYGNQISFTTTCPTVTVSISGTTAICQGSPSPDVTFTGTVGTPPFTINYNVNGIYQTISTTSGNSVTIPVAIDETETIVYTLISAYDANGSDCTQAQYGSVTITVNPQPELSAAVTQISCANETVTYGSIDLTVTSGTSPYSYDWDVDPGEYDYLGEDPDSLEPGIYTVQVIDANNCSDTLSAEIDNPLIVTNTADDSFGSLRWAITYANDHMGQDEISFNIDGDGPFPIRPASPLPVISDELIIDGYSQPGTDQNTHSINQGINASLMVELDGTPAGDNAHGISISADNCVIRGLIINRFKGSGIKIQTGSNNRIEGNFLGTDSTGTLPLGNNLGVQIDGSGNYVGGTDPTSRNLISGNNAGVLIGEPGSGNFVLGNYIGTDISGEDSIPNHGQGIAIEGGKGNYIGGTVAGARNIISGNGIWGIYLNNWSGNPGACSGNVIQGNYIGLNASGHVLGNGEDGIVIEASSNIIGGSEAGSGNVISGNRYGIWLLFDKTTGNTVQGNLIGTNAEGTDTIPNTEFGIQISDGAHGNTIGPDNVISGNKANGIHITHQGTSGNNVIYNIIGTNKVDSTRIGNGGSGIAVVEGATENVIGPGNVISSNHEAGIVFNNINTTGNTIIGNLVGTTVNGMGPLGNRTHGIHMNASGNTIGGTSDGDRNIISANGYFGLEIGSNINVSGNTVLGNFLGTDATGNGSLLNSGADLALNNSSSDTIGGLEPGARNVIGSMHIGNEGAHDNQIIGNYIGLKNNGLQPICADSIRAGILICDASNNTIGPSNTISGVDIGIFITEEYGEATVTTTKNSIIGNNIGTNAAGDGPVPNRIGIQIANVHGITVGGLTEAERNIISGDTIGVNIFGADADQNVVVGNYIGVGLDGKTPIPNINGVWITEGNDNIIGGTQTEARNIISGNSMNGIWIQGSEDNQASGNKIQGNYIGLSADGTAPVGNEEFGIKLNNATGVLIGGPEEGARNIISANGKLNPARHGIHIEYSSGVGNTVQGNYVGTDPLGTDLTETKEFGNPYAGIMVFHSSNNTIINNLVSNNGYGVYIYTNPANLNASNNIVAGNLIGTTADGNNSLGNKNIGVIIQGAPDNKIGGLTETERNIISGNQTGVGIYGLNATNNYIIGNYIGTNKEGSSGLANSRGIEVANQAYHNFIGSAVPGSGNLIAFDTVGIWLGCDSTYVKGNEIHHSVQDGIFIEGSNNVIGGSEYGSRNYFHDNNNGIRTGFEADSNLIEGNYLGTDREGKTDKTDGWEGVAISGSYNLVKNNLISGYNMGHGIYINRWLNQELIPEGNRLEGNIIGMNASATEAIPNQHGICINTAIGTVISKNLIAGNQYDGIHIAGDFFTEDDDYQYSVGNLISQNSIYNNGQLGIDLESDFFTENDSIYNKETGKWIYDEDSGANNLQNFPVFDSIKYDLVNKEVFIGGSLESIANSEFILEFFVSKVTDNTGYGEGQTYLGSLTVNTDTEGKVRFDTAFTAYSSWGDVITATATDSDGNTSEFSGAIGGTRSQILADINRPFFYRINEDGHPNILDGSDTAAVSSAFMTWTEVETADIEFINAGPTEDKYASATDGVNLVSFVDDKYPFAPGVLAMAAKTLKVEPGDDVAKIIDADIVFNPVYLNHPIYKIGVGEDYYDIQSIATHEIGHVLGLIHSGYEWATMFFMLDKGSEARSVETDDKTWVSYRYSKPDYNEYFGSISGNITYGYNGDFVAGALVLAKGKDSVTQDSIFIHAYSDAEGHYEIPAPPGTYNITIEPLDGDVEGYPLKPGNISVYVYANTVYTDYPKEYFSTDEALEEEEDFDPVAIGVSAGEDNGDNNLITNLDLTPPVVLAVSPELEADSVDITQIIKITFSEPVDENTLTETTCYLSSKDEEENTVISTGSFEGEGGDTEIILFVPDEAMNCETIYTLHIIGGIGGVADLKGNELDQEFTSYFTTMLADTVDPVVKSIIPADIAENVYVISDVEIFFSEPMDKNTVEDGFVLSWIDDSENETEVEGSFKWDNNNTIMKFIPLSTFRENEEYTITLPGSITDLSHNNLADTATKFYTVPQAPPEIIYLGPADGKDSVTLNTPVVVDFSEPIDPSSVDYSTFKLILGIDQQVAGSFKFLNDNARVVFTPDEDLLFNQSYTIKITEGIKDVSYPAQNKEEETESMFTTADRILTPHLDYIDPVSGITGTYVTVTGTGFDPDPANNIVLFNGIESEVIKTSLTSMVARVPLGAISGPVTARSNIVESSNSQQFFIIPQSLDPCDGVLATVSTGSSSRDVGIVPDASMAYVTNPDAGTVSVINMEEEEVEYQIQVGNEPMKIDIDPSGTRAYVTNFYSHDVSVIDLTTTPNQVVNTISVGVNPYGIVVTPDGKKVYVANYTSENLSVIDVDPASGGFDHVVANVSTGTRNKDEAIAPEAGLILVTGDDGLNIVSIDPTDLNYNTVIANSSSGTRTHDVDIEAEAGIALVTTEDGNILIIDISPGSDSFGAVLASQTSGSRGGDIEMSGDALFIYITDSEADQVLVYKLATEGTEPDASYYSVPKLILHNTIDVGDYPEGLVIDAENKRLLVVNSGTVSGEASLQVIEICCGPLSPDNAIGELIITIQTMINYKIISEPIGNDMISWLNDALDYYYNGDNKKAINRLNTFIKKTQDLIKSARITKDQGQPLIDAAELIIDMLLESKGESSIASETAVYDSRHLETESLNESTIGFVYPNPSTSSFKADYVIANDNEHNKVSIRIYDYKGKLVTTLVDRFLQTGRYTVNWDGTLENGSAAHGGIYFLQFRAGDVYIVRMIILLR